MPKLDGSNHINLTVTDLDRSARWYCRVFGFIVVNEVTPAGSGFSFKTLLDPRSFASVVLGQADEPDGRSFDERRVGLHHLAFHVPARSDLEEWVAHLDAIHVEHSGIRESGHEVGAQIWLRDPDQIWLELYWVNRDFFVHRLRERWRIARQAGQADTRTPVTAEDLMRGRAAPIRFSRR